MSGDAAIDGHLDAADAQPVIAEAGHDAEIKQAFLLDRRLDHPDQQAHPDG